MTISAIAAWWIAAGVLIALELVTGTFYLLMLSIGVVGGALAAQAGTPSVVQMIVAAAVGGGAVVAWHMKRKSRPSSSNRDVHLDVGERVFVNGWDAQGDARVQYRGTQWPARHIGEGTPAAGEHVIRAIEGNRLMLQLHR
ncbi:MAG: putative rane protein [Rhizobacter sp.]|nr:putative rane protein [Rhizobacter sp.]